MAIVTPLYGHNSFETAYLVKDYPYGRLKAKMWFWLETNKKGVRLVTRSENPKNGRLNKPKPGIYYKVAGNLYLDEYQHCHVDVIHEYSDPDQVYQFLKNFPQNHCMTTITWWCKAKFYLLEKQVAEKKSIFLTNGVEQPLSEKQVENCVLEAKMWWKCFNLSQQQQQI